ncbi:recombinase family protein [Nocardia sp. KC 131]|uniref:recombinase family protein n=1 Tax=Nocardia arseniciresistens TaxID=3392119 RepID=UPI00398F7328
MPWRGPRDLAEGTGIEDLIRLEGLGVAGLSFAGSWMPDAEDSGGDDGSGRYSESGPRASMRMFWSTVTGVTPQDSAISAMVADLRPCDTIIVWEIDRLGRNLRDLIDIVTGLGQCGVGRRLPNRDDEGRDHGRWDIARYNGFHRATVLRSGVVAR